MNCYDCPYCKMIYKNTLKGQLFCMKYTKYIPTGHLAYNFFCWDLNDNRTSNNISKK